MSFNFIDCFEAINTPFAVIERSGRILYKNKAFISSFVKRTKRVFDAEEMLDLLNIDRSALKASLLADGRYAQTSFINGIPVYYTELIRFTTDNTEYVACTVYCLPTLAEGRMFSDPLTGVLNRMGFEYYADKMRSESIGAEFMLMMIDIDRFKAVNDKYGHIFGDEVLTAFAAKLKELQTEDSVCGRFGGDEFTVMHRISDKSHVNILLDRYATSLNGKYNGVNVSCSIGSALADASVKIKDLLLQADRQLLKNKKKL